MSHGLDINRKDSQVVRIPFLDETDLRPGQEGLFTKDRFFLNGYFEPIKSPLTNEIELHFTKRPGLLFGTSISSANVGRRMYFWNKTSGIYSVIGTSIFSGGSNLGVALNITTPTSFVGIAETRIGATTQYLGVNTGDALNLIGVDDSVIVMNNVVINTSSASNPTTITTATNHNLNSGNRVIIRNHSLAGVNNTIQTVTVTGINTFTIPVLGGGTGGSIGVFPVGTTGDLVYMDGYWFVIDNQNKIWNCKVDDPTTWAVTDFINSQMQPGIGVGLARQNNFLVAFGNRHFQMFIDAANPVGSPLQNVEQGMQQIGCADNGSIAFNENTIYWVSDTLIGGFSVFRLEGTTNLKDIATPSLRRAFQAVGSPTFRGFILRHSGHVFYILSIINGISGSTWIYDQGLDIWYQWSDSSGTNRWPVVDITHATFANIFALHISDGGRYSLRADTFQDNGVNFPVVTQTNPLTFGTMARKFYDRAELVGDKQTGTASVLLSFTDDDFTTFSTTRTLDMTQNRMFTRNLSNSRRRAWKVSYTGNTAMRLQGLEFTIELDVS